MIFCWLPPERVPVGAVGVGGPQLERLDLLAGHRRARGAR